MSANLSLGFLISRTADQIDDWKLAYAPLVPYAERRDLLREFGLGVERSLAVARALDDSTDAQAPSENDIKQANACDPHFDPVALLDVVAWGPRAMERAARLSEYESALAQAFWHITRPTHPMKYYEDSGTKTRFERLDEAYRAKMSVSSSRWARKLGGDQMSEWLISQLNEGPLDQPHSTLMLKMWYASGIADQIWIPTMQAEANKEGK